MIHRADPISCTAPAGFVRIHTRDNTVVMCVHLIDTVVTWDAASKQCSQLGGRLVVMDTTAKINLVKAYLNTLTLGGYIANYRSFVCCFCEDRFNGLM